MDSADPDIAAAAAVTAAFHLSGQVCTATERILVHETIHDAFVDRMVARTKELRVGPGLSNVEMGPLVSAAARDKVMRLVEQAVAQGATRSPAAARCRPAAMSAGSTSRRC